MSDFEEKDSLVNLPLNNYEKFDPEKDHDMDGLIILLITSPTR